MPSTGPMTFRTSRAFLVRAVDVGESDRRLTFFTEAAGLLTAAAKAAHRSRKRFGGVLQRYLLLEISWAERAGRLPLLDQARVLDSFWEITADWESVRHADHLLETAAELFPQPGPKPAVFGILLSGFRSLLGGTPPVVAARRSDAALLARGGWGPALDVCRKCGRAPSGPVLFVPSEGGYHCGACRARGGTPLSLGAVRTWRALQSAGPATAGRIRIRKDILEELRVVIPEYIEYCLGIPLRSLRRPGSPKNH